MFAAAGKKFCIILTLKSPSNFNFLQKEHGLLHDRKEKKSYAIVRGARPMNCPHRLASIYHVHEGSAETIDLHGEQVTIHGATVRMLGPPADGRQDQPAP